MRVLLLAVAAIAATACAPASSRPPVAPTTAGATASPTRAAPSPAARLELERVARVEQPVAMAVRAGDPALYVAQRTGAVVAIRDGSVSAPILDLSAEVSLATEQGLLGIAFAPDGDHLYVNFTDLNGDTRVQEFAMRDGVPDPASRRELLSVDQPYSNHNGGNLVFGPDGYLYIGLGDGGSGGDPHGNAQSLSTLLGKMLRISPAPSEDLPYSIPPDNPFVGRDGGRPEIWAYGLRNPWRYSFDRRPATCGSATSGRTPGKRSTCSPPVRPAAGTTAGTHWRGFTPMRARLRRTRSLRSTCTPTIDGGCTVTGGYVYRGQAIASLQGAYVFADFCVGRLEAIRRGPDGGVTHEMLGPSMQAISSFGEDSAGELYVLSLAGGVYRLTQTGELQAT